MFPSGKRYLGVTNDLKRRWREHRRCRQDGMSYRLHDAIQKYGAQNVKCRVLVTGPYDYIRELEITAIAKFKTAHRKHGYNISPGGDLTSEETRKKQSASQTARWQRFGEIEKVASKIRGRVKSP